MSDADIIRDGKSGRFLKGHNAGGPGRPKGARSKLGQAVLEDLRDVWHERGIEALRRCAEEEPARFCSIIASLLPRDISVDISMAVSPAEFSTRFQQAMALLDNVPPKPLKVINGR